MVTPQILIRSKQRKGDWKKSRYKKRVNARIFFT